MRQRTDLVQRQPVLVVIPMRYPSVSGSHAAVECAITPNDTVKAESGAMISMSAGVDVRAKMEGGGCSALFTCCCAGATRELSSVWPVSLYSKFETEAALYAYPPDGCI